MTNGTASSLEDQIRRLLITYIGSDDGKVDDLARRLEVSSDSIRKLLERPHWELALSFRVADELHVPLRVDLAQAS